MTDSDTAKLAGARRQCVIDHSVYNAVSFSGRDLTPEQVLSFWSQPLPGQRPWAPAWGERMTVAHVVDAAKRLESAGFVRLTDRIQIPIRDPRNRRGPLLQKRMPERTRLERA